MLLARLAFPSSRKVLPRRISHGTRPPSALALRAARSPDVTVAPTSPVTSAAPEVARCCRRPELVRHQPPRRSPPPPMEHVRRHQRRPERPARTGGWWCLLIFYDWAPARIFFSSPVHGSGSFLSVSYFLHFFNAAQPSKNNANWDINQQNTLTYFH